MEEATLKEDWKMLAGYLPRDLEASAREHGFVRRSTGRQDAQMWLRLVLMHAAGGLSLAQTVARAKARGWAGVSAVALHKRLRVAGPWLQALTAHVVDAQRRALASTPALRGKVLRIVDATDVQEPGATGTDWRLHYSLRLPDLACDYFELTDAHGGESLGRFAFEPEEVVLADRGYCHRAGVAQVLAAKADVVVRLVPTNFPLQDDAGHRFDPLARCAGLKPGQTREWRVSFEHKGQRYPLRLCALRKPEAATDEARRKLRQKASRKGESVQDQALQGAAFVLLLTSLPQAEWSTDTVLSLYRSRWQIELAFKRLKSLLHAGHVPKYSDPAARAWIQAKVLTALLVESLLCDSRSFSPYSGRVL